MKKTESKYVVAIVKIVLLLVAIVTLTLLTSIYPITVPWKPVFASPDTAEDYVDIQSDVDSVADKGTHSNFENQKATDSTYDTLTEANTNTTKVNDSTNFVDNSDSNVDSHTGHGTHSSFAAMQAGPDSTFDTLTEANTGTAAGSEWISCNAYSETYTAWTEVGTTPYLSALDNPTNIIQEENTAGSEGWFDFPGTTGPSGATYTVNITIYCKNDDGAGNDYANVFVDFTGEAGTDIGDAAQHTSYSYDTFTVTGCDTQAEVNALRVYFAYVKVGAGDDVYIDYVRIGVSWAAAPNYELDLEIQWTTADFDEANEYLCIYIGTVNAEALKVDVRNGGSWTNIIASLSASQWNNVSIGTYLTGATITFRFLGGTETGDTSQSSWQIDCAIIHVWSTGVNYELELEEQFTDCDYTRTFEELCIYMGTMNGETLSVQWWNSTSNSWLTIIASLSSNQWNNVSVVDYLTSATFTILFVDGTKENDLSQGTWQKDACLLHTWTLGYNLKLRVMDLDLTDPIQGAYVYKDSDVKISDVNGWANWTLVSGVVTVQVKYFGFLVNETSINVDSDKTIDVRCNLFDVTVNVKENVRNAKLSNVNVTVYNGTSVGGNKIKSGISNNNGQVTLTNLPNNTLTFTEYGGSIYTLVIGNATQLIGSDDYAFTIVCNQNYVGTTSNYSILVWVGGIVIPLEGSFVTKRLKRKMYKKRKKPK